MTDRLDDIFSPDRLRDSWRDSQKEAEAAASGQERGPLQEHHPLVLVERLQALVADRFSRPETEGLRQMVDELARFVRQKYGDEEGEGTAVDDGQILELLIGIEDLVEALHVGGLDQGGR